MGYPQQLFTTQQEEEIIASIKAFELRTSGEIRVHIVDHLRRPAVDEARHAFEALGMHLTQRRNGVLFLLAPGTRAFALFGDEGIDAVTPDDFWTSTRDAMRGPLAAGDFVAGLRAGIDIAGEALAQHFPYQPDDVNELPDEISYG